VNEPRRILYHHRIRADDGQAAVWTVQVKRGPMGLAALNEAFDAVEIDLSNKPPEFLAKG
jgi:hypothetical protein